MCVCVSLSLYFKEISSLPQKLRTSSTSVFSLAFSFVFSVLDSFTEFAISIEHQYISESVC